MNTKNIADRSTNNRHREGLKNEKQIGTFRTIITGKHRHLRHAIMENKSGLSQFWFVFLRTTGENVLAKNVRNG